MLLNLLLDVFLGQYLKPVHLRRVFFSRQAHKSKSRTAVLKKQKFDVRLKLKIFFLVYDLAVLQSRFCQFGFCNFGPSILSGLTILSNVNSSTKPSFIASSRNVVPFLWAVLATIVALS